MRLRDQADDLAAVLSAEGARDCHLVCWCSGPKTALEFHRRRPAAERASRLRLRPAALNAGFVIHRAGQLDHAFRAERRQFATDLV
jgi:hypothetical protein